MLLGLVAASVFSKTVGEHYRYHPVTREQLHIVSLPGAFQLCFSNEEPLLLTWNRASSLDHLSGMTWLAHRKGTNSSPMVASNSDVSS